MANTYAILNSTIPQAGRALTSTEIKAIRAAAPGARVPSRAYVVQAGAEYRGYVYRPVSGGMTETGITVQIRA